MISSKNKARRIRRGARCRTVHELVFTKFTLTLAVYAFFCIIFGGVHLAPVKNGSVGIPFFANAASVTADNDEKNSKKQAPQGNVRVRTAIKSLPKVKDTRQQMSFNEVLSRAGSAAVGGGISGAVAGAVQVLSLMWLRTVMNYQYRYGTNFRQSLKTLLNNGGIVRLYRGLWFALLQAPLARFGSTAANDGIQSLFSNLEGTAHWGPGRTVTIGAILVALWRMFLTPLDTMKTVLQVDSSEGLRNLIRRVKSGQIGALYQGSFVNAFASMVGHYPWFLTYNYLSASEWLRKHLPSKLIRNASIGMVSSMLSDIIVNCLRVLKTTKQSLAAKRSVGYIEAARMILAADGWQGLFGRGLGTRIFANALQSIIFTVIWRGLADYFKEKSDTEKGEATSTAGSEA